MTLGELAALLLFDGDIDYVDNMFSPIDVYDSCMLPCKINGKQQDTDPDNHDREYIEKISKVLSSNLDTIIDIKISQYNATDGWSYIFSIIDGNDKYTFDWVSNIDIRNK